MDTDVLQIILEYTPELTGDQGCSGKTQPRKTHPVLTGLTHPEKPGDVGFTGFFLILGTSSDDFWNFYPTC